MLLVLDNRDSFVFNLVQLLLAEGAEVEVRRSAEIDATEVARLAPERILIGPGPGTPATAGCSEEVVRTLGGRVPLLGVCLGLQAIGTALGGRVVRARELVHGRTSAIEHDGAGVFAGLRQGFAATRYHSLALAEEDLPDCLEVSARAPDGEIMGARVPGRRLEGVQFHPESVLSEEGRALMRNFLAL